MTTRRVLSMQVARLRTARERAGFTRAALAQAAGVTGRTVSRLETGCPARLNTTIKLARALGVPWRELIGDLAGRSST
jgi:transcriptional regulator with XRE-family HTH domain